MPVRDTIALLRELDPVGARPAAEHRRRRRLPALVTAGTAVLAAGSLLVPGDDRAPSLVEAAHAALTAEDRIVHLRLQATFHHPRDASATSESWSRASGRELRLVFDGGEHEFVRDTDARFAASYVRSRHTLTVFTDPDMWQVQRAEPLAFAGPEGAVRLVEALPALLARAREGDPAVRRLPDATLHGRRAARLQASAVHEVGEATTDGAAPGLRPVEARTVVWLDLDTHLPRRVERFLGDRREATVEVTAARLPADADERLLDMPARPGATRQVARAH